VAETPDLGALIATQIRANGPITVADFMQLCLSHPRHGYYRSGTAIGASGDFVTAPEISQIFGELIGFFVVNLWQQLRQPPGFTLLELGPGRGVLMDDALRAAGRAPGFLDALHLQLFESSADLRAEQQARLSKYMPYWAPEIDAVGDGPLFVVANEFFDALPIRQYVRKDGGWHERLVGLRDDHLAFGLSPTLSADFGDADDGAVREVAPVALGLIERLARKVADQGGAILLIDYGYEGPQFGETLQAVRGHAYADPLESPGETDISAHVDFSILRKAATGTGLKVAPLADQSDFLRRLGAVERAATLASANPGQAEAIHAGVQRLIAPDQMGTLFKVFCAYGSGLEPVGFA
jgi:NADH dehydrogenase [ubiquinone] 1 alpha subcomplex assembly factor 7